MKKRQSFQNRFLALFLVSIVLPIIIMASILAVYFQNRIYKFTEGSPTPVLVAGDTNSGNTDGTGAAARFNTPAGISVDAAGNLFVTETGNHRIRKITPAGVVSTIAGSTAGFSDGDATTARFDIPLAIAADVSNNLLFVADFNNSRIRTILID